ncbi:unnamed protein product [Malus baccata var. baccata]
MSVEEKILVSVRLRPLNDKEKAKNDVSDWCVKNNTVMYNNSHPDRPMSPSAYGFDRVFGWDCPTTKVYDEGAKEVVLSVINGINSTIFAYGQTSSGKTYTMKGITDYAVADIYDYIEKHSDREFVLKFSAMEIYNEAVRDLLSSESAQLRLLDDPEKGTVVEKLSEEILRDRNHLEELLSVCEAQRKIGETSLNETSSRSHQILRLTIESSAREYLGIQSLSKLAATVNFVDLAGSERVSQALSAGTRLKEGCHINRSLLTLGTVIRKLSKGKNGHVPYRDSKLTRILQNSLGGNARTAIICTLSPARSHVEQSKNTLFFASCAKEVTTNAKVNVVRSDKALVKQLQKELAKMEDALRSLASKSMQEKELLLEQMNKEIKELTQQRDLAQSRVQNLLESTGDGQVPRIGENSGAEESFSAGVKADNASDITDRPSFTGSYKHNRQLSASSEENFLLDSSAPEFVGLDSLPDWEDLAEKSLAESAHVAERSHAEFEDTTHVAEISHAECEDTTQRSRAEPEDNTQPAESEDIAQRCHAEPEDIAQRCPAEAEVIAQGHQAESEVIAEASPAESEDSCKEIRCISSMDQNTFDLILSGSEENGGNLAATAPMQQTGDKELNNVNAEYEAMRKKIQEMQRTINNLVNLAPIEQSPSSSESSSASMNLSRSRSCRAVIMSPSSFAPYEAELNENTTPAEGFRQRPSRSRQGAHGRSISREDFPASVASVPMDTDGTRDQPNAEVITQQKFPHKKQKVYQGENSRSKHGGSAGKLPRRDSDQDSILSVHVEAEESTEAASAQDISEGWPRSSKGLRWKLFHKSKQGSEIGSSTRASSQLESVLSAPVAWKVIPNVSESDVEDNMSVLNFANERKEDKYEAQRGAGRRRHNRAEHPLRTPSNWRLDFETQRGLIIELWEACFVPLVHRTHFFILYKGDPSDFLYLEVELRRLTILKDTFSEGSNLKSRQALTPAGREREMLAKKVPKRFASTKEKERLYQKWGIRLNTKQRSLQLANLIWTSTMDMGHIRESATLVAKLVGLVAPLDAPKEILGLSFLSRPINKKSSIWRDSILPLLRVLFVREATCVFDRKREVEASMSVEEKILVSVRLRPLNDKEKAKNDVSDWCVKDNTVMYNNSHPDRPMSPSAYGFDTVFGWDCPTTKVYDEGIKRLRFRSSMSSIVTTIFAYGQTSSGKTYTMKGITDYAVADIYDYIEKHSDREFVLKFSAMEIYNEAVRDLLSSESAQLRLLDDPEKGTVVEKLSEEILRDRNHLEELLSVCEGELEHMYLCKPFTINENSSIPSAPEYLGIQSSSTLAATVNFVDLAGSERVSQALSAGTRLKEGCHINRSLLTLGTVIRKLSKGKNGHVPYRDSKLTRILQNSLGGNARTAIICTLSPARSHVTTNAKVNVVRSDKALVKQLQKELAKMEDTLRSLASKSMQEKELLLEQMDKEIKELTQQRDLAQSWVQNLLESTGDSQVPRIGENSGAESLSVCVKADNASDITDRPSFTGSYKHNRQLSASSEENFLLDSSAPEFVGLDSLPDWEDLAESAHVAERSHAEFEDIAQISHAECEDTAQRSQGEPEDNTQPMESEDIAGRSHSEPEDIAQRCPTESEDIAQRSQAESEVLAQRSQVESEVVAEASRAESEDSCKEIRCISSMDQNTFDLIISGYEENGENLAATAPMQQTGDKELNNVNAEYEAMRKKIQEMQRTINNLVNLAPMEQSPSSSESSSASMNLSRSHSCRAVIMSPSSFAPYEAELNENTTPAEGFRQRASRSRQGAHGKSISREDFPASVASVPMDTDGTRDQPNAEVITQQEFPHKKQKVYQGENSRSKHGGCAGKLPRRDSDRDSILSVHVEAEESTEAASAQDISEGWPRSSKGLRWKLFHKSKQGSEIGSSTRASSQLESGLVCAPVAWKVFPNVFESDVEDNMSVLNFANERKEDKYEAQRRAGRRTHNRAEHPLRTPSNWRLDFETQRGLIIELWEACFVPLVHRTHFFILYKGDPSDFLYLEVELRRLTILKDTFSEGSNLKSRQAPTPAGSMKALKREREMLAKKVPKRFASTKEKERLYQKWGIRLNTKQRSLQLANLIWTSTMDMGHIRESATLVAKLVGLVAPLDAPKEILGLSFLSRPINKKSSIWRDSMSTL